MRRGIGVSASAGEAISSMRTRRRRSSSWPLRRKSIFVAASGEMCRGAAALVRHAPRDDSAVAGADCRHKAHSAAAAQRELHFGDFRPKCTGQIAGASFATASVSVGADATESVRLQQRP